MFLESEILNESVRKRLINESEADENKRRKEESFRRFEIYRERQRDYILQRLKQEFSAKTVSEMRTFTSINLCKRIVDESASIYKNPPTRNFQEVSEQEKEQLEKIYEDSMTNVKLKLANKYEVLEDQCAIYIVPDKKQKKIETRVLLPHHYDVVPDPMDPTKGLVYIIKLLDREEQYDQVKDNRDISSTPTGGLQKAGISDGIDQTLADTDDFKKSLKRILWWSPSYNFMTDGNGKYIDPQNNMQVDVLDEIQLGNPLDGMLPFIDVAGEKDHEFWVRYGNNICDFAIDFGVILSDVVNINRLQGYSQAVIAAQEIPENIVVGPHSILKLQLPADGEAPTPTFEFVTPSPDMNASIELLEVCIRLFLSSRGMDPKTISGKSEGQTFNSGLERLLAMIDKFEASKDEVDLFKVVEDDVFDIYRAWNNYLRETVDGSDRVAINENAFVQTSFSTPELTQTQMDKEDSAIKLLDKGLKSDLEVIMELRGVEEEEAEEILKKIQERKMNNAARFFNGGTKGNEEQPETEDQPEGAVRDELQGDEQPETSDS